MANTSRLGWPKTLKGIPYGHPTPHLFNAGQLTVDRTISLYVACCVFWQSANNGSRRAVTAKGTGPQDRTGSESTWT